MNASWPNESAPEVPEYTREEDEKMLREADELQRRRWGKQEAPAGPPISVINVHSWPPGMAVELDEEFVGITPCQVPVRTTEDFTWPGRHVVVMRCRPVTGGQADIKYWRPGQRVPQRVLFSLPWAPAPRPATALVR